MQHNRIKAVLRAGQAVFGSELSGLPVPEVVRLYAAAGFDFVFIDMEHSPISLEHVAELIRTGRQASITPVVRVPQAEYVWIARVLDSGAQGIIVPRVNSAQRARDVVQWSRYPPIGIRGFGMTSAQTDGQNVPPAEFIEHVHAETLIVIQIERQEAIDDLEMILAVPGLDVACLGFMDLSVDMGIPGRIDHPRMIGAIERLIEVAERNGLAAGIIAPDLSIIGRWLAAGMRFVSYSTDALLLSEAAACANRQLRGLPQKGLDSCRRSPPSS